MKAILILVLLCLFGVLDINGILNGKEAAENTFIYQAAIHRRNQKNIVCSGAIVNSRLILTGARLLYHADASPKDLFAVVGTVYLNNDSSPGISYDIEEIILHRSYNLRTYENDIALLRTVQEIQFTSFIQPVFLPSNDRIDDVNANASGWGQTDKRSSSLYTDRLHWETYTTMSVINCINRLPSDTTLLPPKVDDSFVCTNNLNPNTGVCAGDLGSSLVDGDGKIIGISSWTSCGEGTCPKTKIRISKYTLSLFNHLIEKYSFGHPDVYTRVHSHSDWIERGRGSITFDKTTMLILIILEVLSFLLFWF